MQQIKSAPLKNCLLCGKPLERSRFNGRLEDYTRFLKRKFCSIACANRYRYSNQTLKTKGAYHRQARRHLKAVCESCGNGQKLVAHHIDQDRTNNNPLNLQTLCKPCHDNWHGKARKLGLAVAGKKPPISSKNDDARRTS